MTKSRNLIRTKWRPTEAEIELVRRNFPDSKTADLAQALGVAYHQVTTLAKRIGVAKSDEFLNGPAGNRLDGVRGASSRFTKGNVPWTKGKKLPGFGSKETQFKPGQSPVNRLPLGSFRIASAQGGSYLQIKLTETGYPPHDWVMYHRHVWEQARGPIPEGHMVVFKGERSTNPDEITVDRLECISKQEHMQRHTFHQYGPEIASVVHLRSAITRQINKRAEHEQEHQ